MRKETYKKIGAHATFSGTLAAAFFHFICCGLPALLALLSGVFGVSAVPALDFITASQRTYLLIFGGILLGLSYILYCKEKKCCIDPKHLWRKKWILYTATGFFILGLIFHTVSLIALSEPACH
jgi:hypothetical protein